MALEPSLMDPAVSLRTSAIERPREPGRFPRRTEFNLGDIVSRGAELWPDETALIDREQSLTFAELASRSRAVAAELRRSGTVAGDRIAVAGDRKAETVIAILGVCLAGATFVPLDAAAPPERLRLLLRDAAVHGVIGPSRLHPLVEDAPGSPFHWTLEELDVSSRRSRAELRASSTQAPSVAYIMYTSGSTGVPKGVQIEHHAIKAFFDAHNERVDIRPGDRCLSTGPFHFDVCMMDVFLPLYRGAAAVLPSELPLAAPVLDAIQRYRVTHLYAVGTVLALITGNGQRLDAHDLSSLRVLQTGAEVCNVRVVNQWLARIPSLRFLNSYGPTEATVGCISWLKPYEGPVEGSDCPIGRPHREVRVRLRKFDGTFATQPGEEGELLVAGPQLMRGYWRRPTEDDVAFTWIHGVRYYRTGDFAAWDVNGDLRFLGRRDDEVKWNGHRLHLNEVRRCLYAHPLVENAIAGIVPGREAERRELAVVVAARKPLDADLVRELRRFVGERLPAGVQPTRWGVAGDLPRLQSGKLDVSGVLASISRAVIAANAEWYVASGEEFVPMDPAADRSEESHDV